MKTPIKNISEDQNTITHESGVVTVFERKVRISGCNKCVYSEFGCMHYLVPCCYPYRTADSKNGIFIEKIA
jgi:hypothetical protein